MSNINLLDFILLSFINYRIARLLTSEDAPFGLARRFRDLVGATQARCDEQSKARQITNPFCCLHCLGIYTAILVTLLYSMALHPLPPIEWGLLTLAVAGATSWLYD